MGDLVWVTIFFPKPLKLQIFSLTYNDVRFFFSIIYVMREFSFPRYILASFPPSKSVYRIFFFLKSLMTSSKVNLLAAKIHQTFAQ